MLIKTLDYLPAERVWFVNARQSSLPGDGFIGVHVSLYGHWCHVRSPNGVVRSFPVSAIDRIEWA